MRKNDLILIIVLIVAVLGSGLLAQNLRKRQIELAPSRAFLHPMPLAGFQKFLADIVWMRFLYYAGGEQLTADTAAEHEDFILLIIKLDPDFFRAYHDGALMLGAAAPERALAIIDLGEAHPRIRKRWELPMMGGHLIMRKEWMKHYSGQKINPAQVARARNYFQRAQSLPNHRQTAVSSLVRAKAILRENDFPREINELLEWRDYWLKTQLMYMDDVSPSLSEGWDTLESADVPLGSFAGTGSMFTIEERVLNHIRKVAKLYVQNPDEDPELARQAEEIIHETIEKMFPGMRFDAESYIPYQLTNVRRYTGTIEKPKAEEYVLELDAPDSYAIGLLTARTRKGTARLTVLINRKPVKGLEQLKVETEKETWPQEVEVKTPAKTEDAEEDAAAPEYIELPTPEAEHSTQLIRMPLFNNKGEKDSTIEVRLSDIRDAEHLSYVLIVYKGDYF